jgi:HlyD family secretion protein
MRTALSIVVLLAGWLLAGCAPGPSGGFQGYIEGEFVYVAAPLGGQLTNLAVSRGLEVRAGQLLFQLEGEAEAAALREAAERVSQARSRLENLRKGRRPSEIASIEAQVKRAEANLRLSALDLERRVKLRENQVIAPEELDQARSRRDADQEQVAALKADLETARLGGREDEIKAADADLQATEAALVRARWAVVQKTQFAPTNAWVHDTLYRQGEYVAAGYPVVSLLPPSNLKARFFVPQAQLSLFPPGTPVAVRFDGGGEPVPAVVNYISTQAEYTPPVIYSKENRAKLVFMVEATFPAEKARQLRPGQPVDVRVANVQ